MLASTSCPSIRVGQVVDSYTMLAQVYLHIHHGGNFVRDHKISYQRPQKKDQGRQDLAFTVIQTLVQHI
ncbi:unnamed protein product [Cuscuta epithymum]|uniref:Uncharacterized protein n=1 Tax=Cuscuta epithymum TaxID=186058 RepID=A0AAV0FZU8_9ASTE|nr:unnamed protein product [Cuscuta epithymum]